MSILASKTIAINIVDMQDGLRTMHHEVPSVQDTRIAQLEAEIRELKQWKTTFTPMVQSNMYVSSTESNSAPESPKSMTSLDSSDLPQIDSGLNNEAVKTNLPSKKVIRGPDTDPASKIMTLIQGYGQNEENSQGDAWLGRVKFEPRVRRQVDANVPVELVLPAFPWKSVNKVEKVIGAVPDLGEEMGLGRLQGLCEDIQAIYEPGAYVTITSDGLVYNDLLGISNEEVYDYGIGLRQMAEEKGYDRLRFIRIMNLLGLTDSPHMTKQEYLSQVDQSRTELMEKYLPPDFDVRDAILTEVDINLTYCGYMLFLSKDLRHSPVTAGITGKNEYRRKVKQVAEMMMIRGKAFAAVIEAKMPEHVRLSIHRSTGLNKLSFPLVPQPNHFSMTPWHCSLTVTSKGEFRTAHASEVRGSYDLIEQHGRPYYFRDRSDVWKWDIPVEFEFFYPRGVYVRPVLAEGETTPVLGPKELVKLKQLGKGFSTVIPVGFA